ncbi:sensor histidine kinase [Nonomuraea africana]|uniref:histidine kinase n=1 Tax=Nonomuraea africana TaxID=46171 RepID=A0ABR9K872_9ACTN|nr:HAMP domain-containing sensor histidine kinase [Nonomuraea africana]MBE1558197.1 signal transduction histidine kinase [Nonomuraea africana]
MLTTWSVRRRLTLIAGLTALAGCLIALVVITLLTHVVMTDHGLDHAAAAGRRITFNVEKYAPNLPPLATTEEVDLIQVTDERGTVRQSSARLLNRPPLTRVIPTGDDGRTDTTLCTDQVPGERCLITVAHRARVDGAYWTVYTYAPAIPWYIHPLYVLGAALVVLLLTGLAAAGASATVRRALAPVRTIKEELAEITATDLGRRVPPSRHRDEISDLADTVNQTLDGLEAAVEQQRRFASDASHDLRSPVTAMRAQVEEARLHPEEADWDHTSKALLASLDRLQAIVTDLLTLTRLDSGAPGAKEPVDLAELVAEELDRRPRGKEIVRRLRPGVVVTGDRIRLARLLTNLLDNAERHAESRVTVSVGQRGERALLEVLDDGAGIAPDQREFVFDRFTRLDASRNRDAGGTGLGLPIAREIAHAHDGTLTIEDSPVGARFVLHLPLRNGYHG